MTGFTLVPTGGRRQFEAVSHLAKTAELQCHVIATKPGSTPIMGFFNPIGGDLQYPPGLHEQQSRRACRTSAGKTGLIYDFKSVSWRIAPVRQIAVIMRYEQETRGFAGAPDG
jgi:hypothetical protein